MKFIYNKAELGGYSVRLDGKDLGRVERAGRSWLAHQHGQSVGGFDKRDLAAQHLLDNVDVMPAGTDGVAPDESNDSAVYRVIKGAKEKGQMVNVDQIAEATRLEVLPVKVILMRLHQQGRIIRPKAMRYTIK